MKPILFVLFLVGCFVGIKSISSKPAKEPKYSIGDIVYLKTNTNYIGTITAHRRDTWVRGQGRKLEKWDNYLGKDPCYRVKFTMPNHEAEIFSYQTVVEFEIEKVK